MEIKLYNSATRQKQVFVPLRQGEVSMYVCGVTPYDLNHLGHLFVFITFDTLKRFLTHSGYRVKYVQNITDVDDPLFAKARELHQTWNDIAEHWIQYLVEDYGKLNIDLPDYFIKASDEIPQMLKIIQVLVEGGFAYTVEGYTYFDVARFKAYGSLSGYNRETMIKLSAQRGNNIYDKRKHDPLDFLLWQPSGAEEPAWDSKWGRGRPGWHIECTAMSTKYLGEQIDIHGGGSDLIFPHHESEIAQAESFSHKHPFVNTWMHCSMVYYQNQKMSKSLGNLVSFRELNASYSANTIRYFLLSHHYRKEWKFIYADLDAAAKTMSSVEESLRDVQKPASIPDEFLAALADDLNTPEALRIMLENREPTAKMSMFKLLGFQSSI